MQARQWELPEYLVAGRRQVAQGLGGVEGGGTEVWGGRETRGRGLRERLRGGLGAGGVSWTGSALGVGEAGEATNKTVVSAAALYVSGSSVCVAASVCVLRHQCVSAAAVRG